MSDIKFNCPQCGEYLAVDATDAGTTVACPKCGQAILVPELAQLAAKGPLARGKWWLPLAGAAALALIASLLLWQTHRRPTVQTESAPVSIPAASIPRELGDNSLSAKMGGDKSPSAVPASAGDLMRGLVLHFDFDTEPVAGRIPDLSGQGNNGEAVNVRWVADGHRGGSVAFGLTNSYIRVPNSDSLNPSNLTLAAWIKTSNHGNTARRVFDKDYADGYALSIGGYPLSKPAPAQDLPFIEIGMKINNYKGCTGSKKPVTDGRWHHLAATYNGAEEFFYVDGAPQQQWGRHWEGKVPANSHDLTLGQNRSTPDAAIGEVGASFNGLMDDPMIFKRALSAREIQALYDSQKVASDKAVSTAAETAGRPSAAERLGQVKELYDEGLISKEDYDRKTKEISDSK
jgi:DNA-directed RNA polymerase subunit RPC12/RpoP